MRVFNKKDVFSWSNLENAKTYIGKEGYFADRWSDLKQAVKQNDTHILEGYHTDLAACFCCNSEEYYPLFLPTDKVKEIEERKKYRLFKTFEEFKECTHRDVGDVIVFKEKNTKLSNIALITGYHGSCLHKLGLGCMSYSFQELFYDYLWLDTNNNWQPFGVLENEM